MAQIVEFLLHIDKYLDGLLAAYGLWMYAILALVIFCETGLVVTPFLPGDSLLFAAGALVARNGSLSIWVLLAILCAAAIGGDAVNYWIGRKLGVRLLANKKSRILRPEYVERTRHFFEKYGAKTIILGRFVPIVRTFAPFMAGVGEMEYLRFASMNVIGGVAWVCLFLLAGYLFGELPWVENNLILVLVAVVLVSVLPAAWEMLRHSRERKRLEELAGSGDADADHSHP